MKKESTIRRELAELRSRARRHLDGKSQRVGDQVERFSDQAYGAIEALRWVLDQDAARPAALGKP